MAPSSIIDSHIHLWPESAANPAGHEWMEDVQMLAKQHVLSDYRHAAKQDELNDGKTYPQVCGVVYIETDRRLAESQDEEAIDIWARQPTEEIKFLRSIVEKQYGDRDSQMLLGIVPWAPLNKGVAVFEAWLNLAEKTAGPETWNRIKGFRFLLQAIRNKAEFESLVFSKDFINILKTFRESKGRNFSFDVGVDQHSGGVWQLEAFASVIEQVHAGVEKDDDKVVFILNHMCKPDLTQSPNPPSQSDYNRWRTSITRFSSFKNVYIKLSGAFSELSPFTTTTTTTTLSADEIATNLSPWLIHIFNSFPPKRIMFGSDWPVCNINGPGGEEDSWNLWKCVVEIALDKRGFSWEEKEWVWRETAREAYRL